MLGKPDLRQEAYSLTQIYSEAHFSDIAQQLAKNYPHSSIGDIHEAAKIAIQLHELVQKNPIYNEPFGIAREKADCYLRANLPGLSDQLYSSANDRIMRMYIY